MVNNYSNTVSIFMAYSVRGMVWELGWFREKQKMEELLRRNGVDYFWLKKMMLGQT